MLTIVASVYFLMFVVFGAIMFVDTLFTGIYEAMYRAVMRPMVKVTVEVPDFNTLNNTIPVKDEEDWEVFSDDSDPVMYTGKVIPKNETPVLEFLGDDEIELIDIVDLGMPIRGRRFVELPEVDFQPSPAGKVVWHQSIHAAVWKDSDGQQQFAWL